MTGHLSIGYRDRVIIDTHNRLIVGIAKALAAVVGLILKAVHR